MFTLDQSYTTPPTGRMFQVRVLWSSVSDWAPVLTSIWLETEDEADYTLGELGAAAYDQYLIDLAAWDDEMAAADAAWAAELAAYEVEYAAAVVAYEAALADAQILRRRWELTIDAGDRTIRRDGQRGHQDRA